MIFIQISAIMYPMLLMHALLANAHLYL